MNISPISNRVLVKRLEEEETYGVVIVVDSKLDDFYRGEVVAIGDAVKEFNVGDTIGYLKNIGSPLNIGGEKVTVMLEKDVMVVYE